jgi:hypothetical protein
VRSLDGNLFSSNLKLQYIDFSRNSLAVVGANLLGNLKSLNAVDFLQSNCINVRAATPQAIADLNVQLPLRCPGSPAVTTTPVATITTRATTTPVTTVRTTPVATTTRAIVTVPTVPEVTTTKEPPKECLVPCDEIESLKSTIAEQAKIIADLEGKLKARA